VNDVLDRPQTAAKVPGAEEIVARARALIPTLAARAREDERNRSIAKATIADMKAGDSWLQPPSIKHKVLNYSDDCEVLEIVMPGNFKTVELEQ